LELVKFYGGIDIKIVVWDILEEALNSEILQKVLMKHLQNKTKVDHVLKHLRNGED
jgi:hypothetical protein